MPCRCCGVGLSGSLLCRVRYQQLEEASASLRERIRHLDDMVHCQQKKVKQMVEEVSARQRSWAGVASCSGDISALSPDLTSAQCSGAHSGCAQITTMLALRGISSYVPPADYPSKGGPSPDQRVTVNKPCGAGHSSPTLRGQQHPLP